ncbi:MAG: right-handed parallel beta-helix repeat-containing protein [Bacteroidota bacterium]
MKNITGKIVFTFIIIGFPLLLSSQVSLHVSPEGKDKNPGTLKKPFRTIERAKDEVRQTIGSSRESITVYLHEGMYNLSETLEFTHLDGGTGNQEVIYKAYKDGLPVISGGFPLENWQMVGDSLLKTKANGLNFRQIYVNKRRATRARTPNTGEYYKTKIWDYLTESIIIDSKYIKKWNNFEQVEFVMQMWWTDYYLRLAEFKEPDVYIHFDWMPKYSRLIFQEPEQSIIWGKMFPPKIDGHAFHFENAFEFLDSPGEWYLDTEKDTLYYLPSPGEDNKNIEVIVPALETLVSINGTPDNPVKNLSFEGIGFSYSTWLRPSEAGHVVTQAGQFSLIDDKTSGHPPAAVIVNYAENINFSENVFKQLGASGIDYYNGVNHSNIKGNVFQDISGNGISIAHFAEDDWHKTNEGFFPEDNEVITGNILVSDNYVNQTGRDYYGSIGIAVGLGHDITIQHNEIWETPYTGISVGWGWTPLPNPMKNNIIRNNHIHNVLTMLCDGGGIYTLSNQPGGIIKENYIHDIQISEWALGTINSGIYLDEYSNEITIEMNLLENIMNDPIYNIKRNTTLELTFIKNELWYRRFTEDHKRVLREAGPRMEYRYMKTFLD